MHKTVYEIIVDNIGTVYSGTSKSDCAMTWIAYVDASKRASGRASGESVTMLADGEVVKEHIGTENQKEDSMHKKILPLLQELVYLNVRRWDVERRIETEIFGGAELEFMDEIYDQYIASMSVSCDSPEDAYKVVTDQEAKLFLEDLKEQIETKE